MVAKFIAPLILFAAFALLDFANALTFQTKLRGPNVNDGYSNQKSVLLTGSHIPSNQLCFRSKFFTDQSIRNSKITVSVKTGRSLLNGDLWEYVNVHIFGTKKCSSAELKYIFDYKLPNGWKNGEELNGFREQQIVLARKLFDYGLPESCNKGGEKFLKFLEYVATKSTRETESEKELNSVHFQATAKICYPLLKYSDVPDFS